MDTEEVVISKKVFRRQLKNLIFDMFSVLTEN